MQVLPEVKHSRILITGAQGFIGRYLTREIVKYNPKQPLLLGKSPRRNFEDAPTAEYIQMDLRNRESLESLARLHNFDVIYNLAEKIDQSTGAGKYEEQFAINYKSHQNYATLPRIQETLGFANPFEYTQP